MFISAIKTAMNFKYLQTYEGLVKISQLILGGICRFILSNFGFKYASILGFPYDTVMSVSSASFVTTSILFVTYIISGNSWRLVRSSLFEVLFNACCCFNFLSACSWLLLVVHTFLYPDFLTSPFFVVYPLLIMVNILGFLLGIFYGVDSYLAYKYVCR